jgi:hypothetical protein
MWCSRCRSSYLQAPGFSRGSLTQFFGGVCSIPAVRLFGITDDTAAPLTVWVRLGEDDEEQEERIYRALQVYRRSKNLRLDLRVVLASQPDGVFPRGATVLFKRQ